MPRRIPAARSSLRSKRVELKFYDETNTNSFNAAAISGTIWSVSLINIVQGFDTNQRIGRNVVIKEIRLRMSFEVPSTLNGNTGTDSVRIILYRDRQASANALSVGPTTLLATPVTISSFKNLFNQTRFQFLYDRNFEITTTAGSDGTFAARQFVRTAMMKMNDLVTYSLADGTTNSITSINYGILCISSNAQAVFSINSRVRYIDQ